MLGVERTKLQDFNVLNFLDPDLSSPLPTTLILVPPRRGEGRMASDRCGGGGRSSG